MFIFWCLTIENFLNCFQFKFEDLTVSVLLSPRIYQVEVTVVRPYAFLYFFIYLNNVRMFLSIFIILSCFVKFSIFRKISRRKVFRLIN